MPAEIEWQLIGTLTERNSPGPTLRTAMQRIPPAMRKATELQAVVDQVFDALELEPVHFVVPKVDVEKGDFSRAQPNDPKLPTHLLPEARLLASEAIHHLRTALEYLAHQLVWLDTGAPFEESAFPMCRKSRAWRKALESRLPGVTERHAREIHALQPFHCDWTRQLKELSNADKHRNVFDVGQLVQGDHLTLSTQQGAPHPSDPELWVLTPMRQRVSLQFEDGSDAIETIVRLAGHAARTLASFQPEFGERLSMSIRWGDEVLS